MQLNTELEDKEQAPCKELIDKLLEVITEWRQRYPTVKMNSNIEYNDDEGNVVNIINKYNVNKRVRFTV
jgi:hypothetical protein